MLKQRLIFGPLLIAMFLLLVYVDEWLEHVVLEGFWQDLFRGRTDLPRGLVIFAFGLVVTPLAARELNAVFTANRIATRLWLTTTAAMLGLVLSFVIPGALDTPTAIAIVPSGMIIVFVGSLLTFSQNRNVEGVVAAAGAVVFAMIYLGLMLGFLLALRRWHSAWWIVGIILTTKACDSGAFFTGRTIGKHKLIPWLSPGKTWEGLFGGVVTGMIVGVLLALASGWLPERDHVSWQLGLVCGLVFALVGQFGDLVMSLLKRGAGMKDSSAMLPGLGGVLDVIDSPLMVAPVAFWLLWLFASP